jgi:biopolymer transport protein ExbB
MTCYYRFIAARTIASLLLGVAVLGLLTHSARAAETSWWNHEWAIRKKLTLDTTDKGAGVTDPIGAVTLLVRLHDGNFQFGAAREDGSDIRFLAEDDKTVLAHRIERYDSLLNEAFVWVKVPDLKPGAQTNLWLYYGNTAGEPAKVDVPKELYDADTVVAYHFSENNAAPADATANKNNADKAGTSVTGAQIARGLRLTGQNGISTPTSPSLAWAAGGNLTWSAWIKPAALQPNAEIFSRREGANAFVIGLDNGIPFVEIRAGGGPQKSPEGEALPASVWKHLAVVVSGAQTTVYVDGSAYGTVNAGLPALNSPLVVGKDASGTAQAAAFSGELDEMQISKVARSAGFIKLAALSQAGGDRTAKMLSEGQDESAGEAGGHNQITEHLTLIKDISKDLTFDGWVVIFLCTILAIVGWGVALMKLLYLNKIGKSNKAFLDRWENVASDLTVLDQEDGDSIKTLGGTAGAKAQMIMRHSPIYHIYHLGCEEIQKRVKPVRQISLSGAEKYGTGLSGRSIQAIKATLHGGLMRETQKLNSKLVFLTIGIAGGPYLGLLGTVIGVMITFAVIAKSGEVEVNSIAPGIAGALLATVAGLAVAIPALFAYSYLSTRIKDVVINIESFIDEFIAKMAEHHKEMN